MKNHSLLIFLGSLLLQLFLPSFVFATNTIRYKGFTIVRESTPKTTTSTTFVDLPGATGTIHVMTREPSLLIVRFSGNSSCAKELTFDKVQTSSAGGFCLLKILVNGQSIQPRDSRFDSTESIGSSVDRSYHNVSIDRASILRPGYHTVRVVWAVVNAFPPSTKPPIFTLDSWSLTLQEVFPE